jgi:uncharacterized protein YfiM (DUF2279 family)
MPGSGRNARGQRGRIGRRGRWLRWAAGTGLLAAVPCFPAIAEVQGAPSIDLASFTLPPQTRPTTPPDAVEGTEGDPIRIARLDIAVPLSVADNSYGPPDDAQALARQDRYRSFGSRVGAVKWEMALGIAALTAVNLPKDLHHGSGFHFHNEGWFGHDTDNVGVDKLAHAFNSYLYADILYARMARKTGGGLPSALTAGALAVGLQAYGEIYDGFEDSIGWSWQDTAFNFAGAGFSVLRNAVPGLKDKLDFRLEVTPNSHFYSHEGKEHFRQQHFLMALKLAGFDRFRETPLRLVELQVGYYARGFTPRERAEGDTPERRPFFGIGLNVGELLFATPRSGLTRAARTVLEYLQLPYTAVRIHP